MVGIPTEVITMKPQRTRRIFAVIVAVWGVLLLPGLFWPAYLDTPVGVLAAVPYLSVYLFHGLGVPGLLQHGGACGWGWCAPTLFGWAFLAVFWLGVVWLLARLLAGLGAGRPD